MNDLILTDSVLNKRVFNHDVYQLHKTEFMLGQTRHFIDPAKALLDVGAAVGMYSYFWSKEVGVRKVFSFEAVTPVFKQTQITAKQTKNMFVYNTAMSNFVGQSSFWVDDKRLSNSSFRNLVGGQKIDVPVTCIDTFVSDHAAEIGPIGFIKIDVEGDELKVLQGGEAVIKEHKPVIMCEIYPKFNDGPIADTFEWLFNERYQCWYNIRGQGLKKLTSIDDGITVASDPDLIQLHDGDFIFSHADPFK